MYHNYAVKTVENLFTWRGQEILFTMMMENELFMIFQILEINHKIIHEGIKYRNVYVHTLTRTHAHKNLYKYTYI